MKGIATDPAQPAKNSEYPTRTNTFNWYEGQQYSGRWWNLNNAAISDQAIWLPWEQTDNTNVTHILGKRDYPKDGWELLKRDLGYDDSRAPIAGSRNPYVVLYNKRSGMLRVFVAMGDLFNSYQFAEFKLRFAGRDAGATKKAGTLNRLEGIGTALENTTTGTESSFIAVAPFLNYRAKWFMADFPMEYDPCVCQFDSKFVIDVRLISQADIKTTGVTTGTVVTTTSSGTQAGGDFDKGTPLLKKAGSAVSAGQKTYKSLNSFASGVKEKLTAQGTKSNTTDAVAKKDAVDKLTAALAKSDFLKNGLKALPYIGAAVSAFDAFFGGGKEESTPAPVALQPMTVEMNTTTTGTVTATNLYSTITFNNPGTRAITTREEYPYYNEAMGVLSVLRQPVLELKTSTYYDADGQRRTLRQYRVPEPIQYLINPASGLEVQDFQVAVLQEGLNYPTKLPDGAGWEYEGMTSTGAHVLRSYYEDAGLLGYALDMDMTGDKVQSRTDGSFQLNETKIYLKFLLNLRVRGGSATTQNVLLVLKYPVTVRTVTSFTTLATPPVSGVLPQATATTVQAFCNGSVYTSAVALLTSPPKTAARTTEPLLADVLVYPNPAASTATLQFTSSQAGAVTVYLTDMMGHRVATLLDQEAVAAGSYEKALNVAQVAPGFYQCVIETSDSKRTTKTLSIMH